MKTIKCQNLMTTTTADLVVATERGNIGVALMKCSDTILDELEKWAKSWKDAPSGTRRILEPVPGQTRRIGRPVAASTLEKLFRAVQDEQNRRCWE